MEEMNLADVIVDDYEHNLLADGKSPSTIESYVGDVRHFLHWLKGKEQPFSGTLKRLHITSYRRHLIENNFEVATINKKVNSLQSFNRYLVETSKMTDLVVDLKKDKVKVAQGSEREVDVLTEKESERLLYFMEDEKRCSQREKVILSTLLFTGIRVTELVTLRLRDIDLLSMVITVRGKGGKVREVPLKSEVVDYLREYLEGERRQNKYCESDFVLLTQRAGKMDRDAVNKILNRIGKELGMSLHPHKFRHTFCTRLLNRNVPLTTVARLAGHAGVQTTAMFYINTSRQDKQMAVDLL